MSLLSLAISKTIKIVLGPVLKLGEKYLDSQTDQRRLEAAVSQTVYRTDAMVRNIKFTHLLGRTPLFIAELSCSLYVAAILIDSTMPTHWLTPLELPEWFKPHFTTILASVAGLAAVERIIGNRK